MKKLNDLELVNPVHIQLVEGGNGEFPDSYRLTEAGIQKILEYIFEE